MQVLQVQRKDKTKSLHSEPQSASQDTPSYKKHLSVKRLLYSTTYVSWRDVCDFNEQDISECGNIREGGWLKNHRSHFAAPIWQKENWARSQNSPKSSPIRRSMGHNQKNKILDASGQDEFLMDCHKKVKSSVIQPVELV